MPRFVVLEHRIVGTHWDLMLQDARDLRTWALDAPPALDVDIPARELAAHRLIYLDYEGPISADRGEVRRVAAGTFVARCWNPGKVAARLSGPQLRGEMTVARAETGVPGRDWVFRLGNVD